MSLKLLKLSACCSIAALALLGCNTITTPIHKAETVKYRVTVNAVSPEGVGAAIGTVTFSDSARGLVIQNDLSQLTPGYHGFHIHEKGSCEPAEKDGKMGAALAAGSHYNPNNAPHHGTPNDGHLGDLPVLNVDSDGKAQTTVIAPRLKLADIKGLSIMVHEGGDNYSDSPAPLGGGGNRVACGLI